MDSMFDDQEEGEVVSDIELDGYNINERENLLPPVKQMEQDELPSEDDEDSVKIPLLQKAPSSSKYNVWQIDQSEDLALSFNCSLSRMQVGYGPMDRDVESYCIINPSNPAGIRPRKFISLKAFQGEGTRRIAPLSLRKKDDEELAEEICKKLYEKNKCLIHSAVEVLGRKKVIELFKKTRKIEKNGGLLVLDRSRKRSSGGVFLFLIHQDKTISQEDLDAIFGEDRIQKKQKVKKKKKKKKSKSKENDFTELLLKTRAEIELERAGRTPPPSPASPSPAAESYTANPPSPSPEMITS